MSKEVEIQNELYLKLIDANIQPITARYVAMRLQNMKSKKILEILEQKENEYIITTNFKKYIVTLPSLPITDAKIIELEM